MSSIILTPINLIKPSTEYGEKARTDYLREKPLFTHGVAKWDDSKFNSAVIGDMFGFVHQNENRVEVFEIVGITNMINRPDYWDIKEHLDRNVLHLSPIKSELRWTEYKQLAGYKENYSIRGTTKSKWNLKLNQYINDKQTV
jgi:hypothetical protein